MARDGGRGEPDERAHEHDLDPRAVHAQPEEEQRDGRQPRQQRARRTRACSASVLARARVGLLRAGRFVVGEAKLRILLGSIERPGSVRFVVFHGIEPTRCPRRRPLPSVSVVHHSSETTAPCPGSPASRLEQPPAYCLVIDGMIDKDDENNPCFPARGRTTGARRGAMVRLEGFA